MSATTTTTTTSPMTANMIEVAVNSAKPPVPIFALAQPASDALFDFVQAARKAGVLGNVLEEMNLPNYREDDYSQPVTRPTAAAVREFGEEAAAAAAVAHDVIGIMQLHDSDELPMPEECERLYRHAYKVFCMAGGRSALGE